MVVGSVVGSGDIVALFVRAYDVGCGDFCYRTWA